MPRPRALRWINSIDRPRLKTNTQPAHISYHDMQAAGDQDQSRRREPGLRRYEGNEEIVRAKFCGGATSTSTGRETDGRAPCSDPCGAAARRSSATATATAATAAAAGQHDVCWREPCAQEGRRRLCRGGWRRVGTEIRHRRARPSSGTPAAPRSTTWPISAMRGEP